MSHSIPYRIIDVDIEYHRSSTIKEKEKTLPIMKSNKQTNECMTIISSSWVIIVVWGFCIPTDTHTHTHTGTKAKGRVLI